MEKTLVDEILSGKLSRSSDCASNMAYHICKSVCNLSRPRDSYDPKVLEELDSMHRMFMAQRLYRCAHEVASASKAFIGSDSFEKIVREIIIGI